MSKPLGVRVRFNQDGPSMSVTRPSGAEDAVWNAVEEAQAAGWTPKQFLREIRAAWLESRRRDTEHEMKEIDRWAS